MKLFHKKETVLPIPEPFSAEDIQTEASICTGERTIGFYDRAAHRLRYAELVRSEQDVRDFFRRYGAPLDETALRRLMRD